MTIIYDYCIKSKVVRIVNIYHNNNNSVCAFFKNGSKFVKKKMLKIAVFFKSFDQVILDVFLCM